MSVLTEFLTYVISDLASNSPILTSERSASFVEALLNEHVRQLFEQVELEPHALVHTGHVQAALDFMQSNFKQPIKVSDIATAVGISPRMLQAAFRKHDGTTPWSRLVSIRLEEVHRRLASQRPGRSVTDVALQCGFSHLGRFSKVYLQTYGELPSETFRRHRKN